MSEQPKVSKPKPRIEDHSPWLPPKWEDEDAGALQALMRGEAEPHQQKRALDWIINIAAATYQPSYRPNSERDSCFAEGRRYVGLHIVTLLKLNLNVLRRAEK